MPYDCNLPINTVVRFKKNHDKESGKATIIGYDCFHSKYHVAKHFLEEDKPMEKVQLWLFSNEVTEIIKSMS